jgi:hypothetical protein
MNPSTIAQQDEPRGNTAVKSIWYVIAYRIAICAMCEAFDMADLQRHTIASGQRPSGKDR